MSFRNVQGNSLRNSDVLQVPPWATSLNGAWVRNPSWLPLASITSSEQKFVGLYQINRYANFIALNFTTSGGAQYTVDWGDGSAPVNVNSGTPAYYEYDWTDVDLDDTDAPVTFQDSGDTVTRNNHGYVDGMNISFATVVTTTGITATQTYFVVNATTNTFQVANTVGGAPIALTNDGTGTILPYKQVIVTVTPVSGNFTVANLNVKHNQVGLTNGYTASWLDVAFAGSYTTLTCQGNLNNVRLNNLQQINILSSALTSYASLFLNLPAIFNIVGINSSASVTSTVSMFQGCVSLKTIPTFNMNTVSNASAMFQSCTNLNSIPYLNTSNVTNFVSTFNGCRQLPTIPALDMSAGTNTVSMFSGCTMLQSIPLMNTINVANMQSMFNGCSTLQTIPLLNTSNVTNMRNMFNNCVALQQIPLIDTSKVISLRGDGVGTNGMFQGCSSLITIPLLNTVNVTSMAYLFSGCQNLINVPLLNTSNVTDLTNMFSSCGALQNIPNINSSNVLGGGFNISSAFALQEIPALDLRKNIQPTTISNNISRIRATGCIASWNISNGKLSAAALDEIYTNLGRVGNVGTANNAVTFQDTGDTVTKVGHGFANNDAVKFSTITTTTGITTNTNYYTINVTANTFQVTSTLGGSAINLVNNGTGLIANATITVTGNYGTATDNPAIATAKGWVVTGS